MLDFVLNVVCLCLTRKTKSPWSGTCDAKLKQHMCITTETQHEGNTGAVAVQQGDTRVGSDREQRRTASKSNIMH